jgi:hypothetical protein
MGEKHHSLLQLTMDYLFNLSIKFNVEALRIGNKSKSHFLIFGSKNVGILMLLEPRLSVSLSI